MNTPLSINIYTVLAGSYDIVFPQFLLTQNIRLFLITPTVHKTALGWTQVIKPLDGRSSRQYNRFYKILPTQEVLDCDVCIYVDANIRCSLSLMSLAAEFSQSCCPIGFFRHPLRTDFLAEHRHLSNKFSQLSSLLATEACLFRDLCSLSDHAPPFLTENGVIFRSTRMLNSLESFQQLWFDLTVSYSGRDQLSLINARMLSRPHVYDFGRSFRIVDAFHVYPHSGPSIRDKLRSFLYCYSLLV